MNILIQFPTRDRRVKFFSTLDKYYSLLENQNNTFFHIILDNDDRNKYDFSKYKNIIVTRGNHKSKVEAINDFSDVDINKFHIIVLASDDMIPQVKGYDNIIRDRMHEYYPNYDGVLWFFDGYRSDLNTLSILGINYYKKFGYIYNPIYRSLYCDDEFMQVANMHDKQSYLNECIIKHEHPIWTGIGNDALQKRNDSYTNSDKRTFEQRKKINFGYNMETTWDILICTIDGREKSFNELIENLNKQINNLNLSKNIKISFIKDNKQMSIGEKRSKLLNNSRAQFVSFIDDDDNVSDDYIKSIYDCLLKNPDCVGMVGILMEGELVRYFIHSIRYNRYFEADHIYYRPPNHLNPIRRELVRKIQFNDKNFGEDTEWAIEILSRGVLKTEEFIERPIYFYYS